ncbi:MAG: outer membrane beta-barrel protein [Hyphomicrobium sp.]|jgi:opacity protein-like surface antigen
MRVVTCLISTSLAAFILTSCPAQAQFIDYWQGLYIGVHGGYGSSNASGAFDTGEINSGDRIRSDVDADGGLGGVQIGYNFQSAGWVYGIEGDWSFTDWSERRFDANLYPTGTDNISTSIDWLASLRGRLGFSTGSTLIYATAGVAWIGADADACDCETGVGQTVSRGSVSFNDTGWVAGGGIETSIGPSLSLRGEALYYGFDSDKNTSYLTNASDPGDFAALDSIWVARIGLNYRFVTRRVESVPLK